MIRICSPQLGLSPESNLGGEVHDREMIKALDELGIELLIILPWGKKYPPLKHAKIYLLPIPFIYPPWIFNLLILPYLFFLYWKYRFNYLRVHSPYFVGIGALMFKSIFSKVQIIATYHHLENNTVFSLFDGYLIHKFDKVVVVSEKTENELIQKYGNIKKINVISNGVDPKYIPITKKARRKKFLLYLGQLIERKNIPFLFQVINFLPADYELIICGDGPLRSELEKMAPKRVTFTGNVSEEDKLNYYREADIFVYPSRKEGFGLAILEALSCGLPVITLPGLVEKLPVIELENDPKLWASKIMTIKYGKSLLKIQDYSWKNFATKYLLFLKIK